MVTTSVTMALTIRFLPYQIIAPSYRRVVMAPNSKIEPRHETNSNQQAFRWVIAVAILSELDFQRLKPAHSDPH